MPAAFIPICRYQGKFLGSTMPGVDFTICDIFQPTLVGNHLCFSLNTTKIKKLRTEPNQRNGLLLVIDSGDSPLPLPVASAIASLLNNGHKSEKRKQNGSQLLGRIFINTLSHFQDNRAGTYILQGLKKMTGTSNFLELSNDKKGCQIEPFEQCVQRRFLEQVHKKCRCLPWLMSNDRERHPQVSLHFSLRTIPDICHFFYTGKILGE